MFDLQKQTVKLASLNARAEVHGDERKPAFDLKFEAVCSNDVLIAFHPELRGMLFKKAEDPDLVEQIDPEQLTALRFPKMGTVKWDWEGSGYTVTVDYGLGDQSDIKLGDCKIDGIRIDPMNGGSVMLGFRVICHPNSEDVGRLCEFIQRDLDITVSAPEPMNVHELFGEEATA